MAATRSPDLSQFVVRPPEPHADNLLAWGLQGVLPICLRFTECPEWLSTAISALPAPPESSGASAKGRRGGLQGWMSDYPIFAALAYPTSKPEDAVSATAKAALLVAVVQGVELATGKQQSIREVAGRAVRRICSGGRIRDLAEPMLLKKANSLEDLAADLHGLTAEKMSNVDRDLISAYARFLAYASGLRKPPLRLERPPAVGIETDSEAFKDVNEPVIPGSHPASSPRIDQEHRIRQGATSEVSEELDEPAPPYRSRSHHEPLPRTDRETRIRHGAPGARETPTRQDYEISDSVLTSGRSNTRMTTLRAHTRARAIAASAQNLAHGSDRLQLVDLSALLGWCRQPFEPTREGQGKRAVADLLLSMLFTGRSLEAVHRAKRVSTSNSAPDFALLEAPLAWVLSCPRPPDAFEPSVEERALYRPASHHLLLPIPLAIGSLPERLATGAPGSDAIFGAPIETFKKWAQKAIGEINRTSRSRLTLDRISDFLSEFISFSRGDQADGAFFAKSADRTACAARLYYYAPSLQGVADSYRTAWDSIVRSIDGMPQDLQWSWTEVPDKLGALSAASAGCPHEEVVNNLGSRLQAQITAIVKRRGRPTREHIENLHNALTVHTVLLLAWTGALRLVTDPIPFELVDPEQGYLAVSEKDSEDYSLVRLVWLPPIAMEQLRHYADHRNVLLKRRRELKILKGAKRMPETWCFFMELGQPRPVTPSTLERAMTQLKLDYPLRLNAQRHYLRTVLRERGVSGAAVDALLGHGAFGEEPYARYSAYSPREMRRELESVLPGLLLAMGWRAMSGLKP